MRGLGLGLAAVIGVVVGNACLLDLEHEVACGDGWVDDKAGEECDPADDRSYVGRCDAFGTTVNGTCDPETCTLVCSVCGDGNIDEATEECDAGRGPVDAQVDERSCKGLDAPHSYRDYESGRTSVCLSNCKYDRTDCGFCGNGVVEGSVLVANPTEQDDVRSEPEWCDGTEFDPVMLRARSPQACRDVGAVANVLCEERCHEFLFLEPACCLERATACPAPDAVVRCCHEYLEPGAETHCGGNLKNPGSDDSSEPESTPVSTCL